MISAFIKVLSELKITVEQSENICAITNSCIFSNVILANKRINVSKINTVTETSFKGDLFLSFDSYMMFYAKNGEMNVKGNIKINVKYLYFII